jgi:two-component system NtrC family sensor kinase
MKKLYTILKEWIAFGALKGLGIESTKRNYQRIRVALFSTIMAITIVPLMMIAGLSYYNYNDLLIKEERDQLESRINGSIRAISAMMENLKTVIEFIARQDRYSELTTLANLEKLFIRLKQNYAFFADIGVIDSNGIQQSYYGPYDLESTDYSNEQWFIEVLAKGIYISKVYLGYRQVPHFTIAVSNYDPITRKQWVLRTTIDASTLQEFINTIKTDIIDDIFLIDQDGLLQTSSALYGEALSIYKEEEAAKKGYSFSSTLYGEPLSLYQEEVVVKNGYSFFKTVENYFHGTGKIKNTPWTLVLVEKRYVHHQDWLTFRNKLASIVIFCIFADLLIVYGLASLLTNLIRRSDEMHVTLMQEAEHSDRLASIGRLAAGVGHEINNPLAIINEKAGLVEDLLAVTPDFEHKKTITGCLQSIGKSVTRCSAITHRLLGFAKRRDVKNEKLQVNDILKEVMVFLENSMLTNRIKIDSQLQEDLPEVVSDHMQLQQVFLNILNNAIDAVGKDGNISVMSHAVAGDVRIIIQDDGPGIGEDILPHIFEPFFTTKESDKGTGLGLSITYGLIKKLGGDITVRSHIGRGTAFTVTIPV